MPHLCQVMVEKIYPHPETQYNSCNLKFATYRIWNMSYNSKTANFYEITWSNKQFIIHFVVFLFLRCSCKAWIIPSLFPWEVVAVDKLSTSHIQARAYRWPCFLTTEQLWGRIYLSTFALVILSHNDTFFTFVFGVETECRPTSRLCFIRVTMRPVICKLDPTLIFACSTYKNRNSFSTFDYRWYIIKI